MREVRGLLEKKIFFYSSWEAQGKMTDWGCFAQNDRTRACIQEIAKTERHLPHLWARLPRRSAPPLPPSLSFFFSSFLPFTRTSPSPLWLCIKLKNRPLPARNSTPLPRLAHLRPRVHRALAETAVDLPARSARFAQKEEWVGYSR